MAIYRCLVGALGLVICLAYSTLTEAAPGTISGSVFAFGGSRLPGARIECKHQGTGQTFSVVSGDRGLYRAANLPSGTYELTAALSGFEPNVVSGIDLSGDTLQVVDFVLSVALTINEVVTDLGEEPTPGYAIANLKVGVRLDRLLMTGGVDNLFNKFYIEYLSYQRDPFRLGVRLPEPGRNVFFNVSYRF